MHRGQEKRACLQALACQAVGSGNEVERRLASTVEGRKAWGNRAVHIQTRVSDGIRDRARATLAEASTAS